MNDLKKTMSAALLLAAMTCAPAALRAQTEMPVAKGWPPIMQIQREFTKPGKGGDLHEKTEAAYAAAARAGKAPFHYLAAVSLSGPDRALFLNGYGSLADWEAEHKALDKMPATGAALDHANVADGELLASTDSATFLLRKDLSLKDTLVHGARYLEVNSFYVKPGHMHEFDEWVKMYAAAMAKVPGVAWVTYQEIYGSNSNHFVAFTLVKSMTEADQEFGPDYKLAADAMGAEGLKKSAELEAACIESEQENLFLLSPKMSMPLPEWVADEPEYWTPKAAAKKP